MRRRLRLAARLAALLLALSASASVEAGSPEKAASRLAGELLAGVPPGSRVAVRPLHEREAGLPREIGGRLYEALLNAVVRSSAATGVEVLARDRLRQVYDSLDEFGQGDTASMLRAARADVEIICKAYPVAGGVALSCGAVDLAKTVQLAHSGSSFPMERSLAPLSVAVTRISQVLAEQAREAGTVGRAVILDALSGTSTELGAHVAGMLEIEVGRLMTERARREANAARATGLLATAPAEEAGEMKRYRLAGTLRRLDSGRLRIDARLEHDRLRVAVAGADVSVASLPSGLIPGHGGAGRMWEATAEAIVSDRLDRASAKRAARNLARARVVAQALDLPSPRIVEVTTEAEAVSALEGLLDMGLPVEERFREEIRTGGGERIAVRLAARVVPVGAILRPEVSAALDRAAYGAFDPIRVTVRSEEAAYLGVFAWGADSRVVRLWPRDGTALRIGAGETLPLPRRGEGAVRSAPLPEPGNREDHEALIVVASPKPFDAAALAPSVGSTLAGTMQRAVDSSGFLAALAGQDPARLAVLWLPYSVHE